MKVQLIICRHLIYTDHTIVFMGTPNDRTLWTVDALGYGNEPVDRYIIQKTVRYCMHVSDTSSSNSFIQWSRYALVCMRPQKEKKKGPTSPTQA